jgi:hypothetical protein
MRFEQHALFIMAARKRAASILPSEEVANPCPAVPGYPICRQDASSTLQLGLCVDKK